jgi:hypothetical protein
MRFGQRIVILCLVFVALASAVPAKKSKSKRSAVRPVQAYTLAGCETCASLKRSLRSQGVHLDITHVDERYFSLYPTVFYSDDTYDHGDRIFSKRCSLPSSLDVIETD